MMRIIRKISVKNYQGKFYMPAMFNFATKRKASQQWEN